MFSVCVYYIFIMFKYFLYSLLIFCPMGDLFLLSISNLILFSQRRFLHHLISLNVCFIFFIPQNMAYFSKCPYTSSVFLDLRRRIYWFDVSQASTNKWLIVVFKTVTFLLISCWLNDLNY